MEALPPELALLLSCARTRRSVDMDCAIRLLLERGGIDWKLFAKLAVLHGLASLAGDALLRVAPDQVPDDILEALDALADQHRLRNTTLLDGLGRVVELLRNEHID